MLLARAPRISRRQIIHRTCRSRIDRIDRRVKANVRWGVRDYAKYEGQGKAKDYLDWERITQQEITKQKHEKKQWEKPSAFAQKTVSLSKAIRRNLILVTVPTGLLIYPQVIGAFFLTYYCLKNNIDIYDTLDDWLPEFLYEMPVYEDEVPPTKSGIYYDVQKRLSKYYLISSATISALFNMTPLSKGYKRWMAISFSRTFPSLRQD